jgi:16S rRNA processing protein RimM
VRIVPGNKTELISIGSIAKVHGINGEVMLVAENPLKFEILETEQLFIRIDGLPVPFFLSTIEERNEKTFVLLFESINSRNEADELVGCEVLIEQKKKKTPARKKIQPASIIGYSVVDQKHGNIGIIEEIIEYPNNSVLKIIKGKNEILVPVHEDIILEVDNSKKEITIAAPEGLINLYLSSKPNR